MENRIISCSVSVTGTVLSCPVNVRIAKRSEEIIFGGTITWGGKKLSDTLALGEHEFPKNIAENVDTLLPGCTPKELTLLCQKNKMLVSVTGMPVVFRLVKASGGAAVLFAFELEDQYEYQSGEQAELTKFLREIADFFGIRKFMFYAQTGSGWFLPEMGSREFEYQVPAEIRGCSFFTCAQMKFTKDSLLGKGISDLLGVSETEIYLGSVSKNFVGMISLPEIRTQYMKSSNMLMYMQFGKNLEFILKGSFEFSMLPEIQFQMECGVSNSAFELSALAHMDKPFPLVDFLSLGDTCLMFRIGKTIEIGMYSTLYIRQLAIFGAVLVGEEGTSFVPKVISAALINELSISSLISALTGEEIGSNSNVDFIKIKGLDFQEMTPFDVRKFGAKKKKNTVKNVEDTAGNVEYVVDHFNSQIRSEALKLYPDQVQLTSYEAGTDLADLKRMRHYFIDRKGNVQLSAQFYYSCEDTRFGNYTVEQGIFFCGVLEILKARFEVLFSWRKSDECILAYARVSPIDLGFLRIDSSGLQSTGSGELPIAGDSVMSQLVDLRKKGMVFFLSASKKEVSFYFDGMVEILGMLRAQARILFVNGLISLDICTDFCSVLKVSLHLKVSYGSFSSGSFQFSLMIDTTGLTEKMKNFTQKIDQAVRKLHDKIDNADREIATAQNHVNELYNQIRYLDNKISECTREIDRAPWWKKAFVAIGKGLEIGAYEVAKGGIYAAIGVATAALEVARALLNFVGKLGEGVLKAISTVVQGAMSLFYINYVKLEVDAGIRGADFHAEMEIVLLGKTYRVSKDVGRQALSQNAAGALENVIDSDRRVSEDIKNIEEAANRSHWRRYRHEEYAVEENKRNLGEMMEYLDDSVTIMRSMQESYMQEFHVPMEEFNEMNLSVTDAFAQAENILSTGVQTGDTGILDQPMEQLKKIVNVQGEEGMENEQELAKIRELVGQYDEASELHGRLRTAMEKIHERREEVLAYNAEIYDRNQKKRDVYVNADGNLGKVITEVEKQMYQTFPVDRSGRRLINISRERVIRESFEEAEKMLDVKPGKYVRNMRSRGEIGTYQNRLQ